jgi:hypothetical protein
MIEEGDATRQRIRLTWLSASAPGVPPTALTVRGTESSEMVARLGGTESSNPLPSSGQSVSRGTIPSYVEKPRFSRGCAGRSR